MNTILEISAIICGIIGIIGSLIPVLPGPPVSFLGMLILYMWGVNTRDDISLTILIVWLIVTIVVTVVDFLVPAYFTKKFGGSKAAGRASLVGMLLAVAIAPPLGMIAGAFLGALVAELLIGGKDGKEALKSAFGSFIGFLAGTGMKLMAGICMLYYIIVGVI